MGKNIKIILPAKLIFRRKIGSRLRYLNVVQKDKPFACSHVSCKTRSMNILLVSFGSAGDIYPYLAIGKELRERNHSVTFITNQYFRNEIEEAGLKFRMVGTKDEFQHIVQNPLLFNSSKAFKFVTHEIILKHMREFYEAIRDLSDTQTLVIAQSIAPAARIAHEKLGISYITLNLQPMSFWSIHQPPRFSGLALPEYLPYGLKSYILNAANEHVIDKQFAPEINKFLDELGLPPQKNFFTEWMYSPQMVIGAFPEWFASPAPDWPPSSFLCGFIVPPNLTDLSSDLETFLNSGEPPLLFTAGSAMQHAASFFLTAAEVTRKLKTRSIFNTSYPEQVPPGLGNRFFISDYVSYQKLLPKVKAVVHHGGIGTIAHALAAGKPQLIVPFAHDQPDNAYRAVKLGVASKVTPRNFKTSRVVHKLKALLTSRDVEEKCAFYAGKIDFDSNLNYLADLIEDFGYRNVISGVSVEYSV